MDKVLNVLGGMGQRCGRGVIGEKGRGLRVFVDKHEGVAGDDKAGQAARGKLLGGCLLGLEGGLRRRKEREGEDKKRGGGTVAGREVVCAREAAG